MAEEKKYNILTPEEERVIVYKGTEYPHTGHYIVQKVSSIAAAAGPLMTMK
jgi:peptide methionine sulfoxide reductase MsrB